MIVRISGEDQYRLAADDAARLNELENDVIAIVKDGRESDFPAAFAAVLSFVREQGEPIGDAEIETSDVILPPSDATFQEAGREFTGEGLIPD
jgi:hypothetical protein